MYLVLTRISLPAVYSYGSTVLYSTEPTYQYSVLYTVIRKTSRFLTIMERHARRHLHRFCSLTTVYSNIQKLLNAVKHRYFR